MSKPQEIIIVENSALIFYGLSGLLTKSGSPYHVMYSGNLNDTEKYLINGKQSVSIINPSLILNNVKTFLSLRNEYPNTKWIAIVYAFYDPQLISFFDDVIYITDSAETIISTVKRAFQSDSSMEPATNGEMLSERETEVLQLMATGLSNKEIADKLNISINTAITHRKNISQKTGIKSISGLTIYAVAKKLINLDSIP